MSVDATPTRHTPTHTEEARPQRAPAQAREIKDVQETTCCIVGGGPAGMVLGLLLARQSITVTLLEQHEDFDRDFRGDSVHPSTLEILDEIGLADKLLELPHSKLHTMSVPTPNGPMVLADFRRLKTKFPYIMMLPQVHFLNLLAQEATRYPNFRLVMDAVVQELVEESGIARGVRYRGADGWHEVRALLTVGADGRFSKVRQLAEMEPVKTSQPMDVLWFRLPRKPNEEHGGMGRIGRGHMLAMLDRGEQWQLAYVIPKGTYQQLRAEGLDALHRSLVELYPPLADRVHLLDDWKDLSLLAVESSRCKRWYTPGLLLIGDAAHVMSPVGGVGINYAVQDAVVAANVLTGPLQSGRLKLSDLAAVQRRREVPTRVIQTIQNVMANLIVGAGLKSDEPLTPPKLLQLPIIRDIPTRLLGLGIWRVHVRPELRRARAAAAA